MVLLAILEDSRDRLFEKYVKNFLGGQYLKSEMKYGYKWRKFSAKQVNRLINGPVIILTLLSP